jgi:hypothetical protein
MIAAVSAATLLAVSIIGVGVWAVRDAGNPLGERRADQIRGLLNVRKADAASLKGAHAPGRLNYKQNPGVGGAHSAVWQNCAGDVYAAPIATENAVHSLEHGAVWITYRTGLGTAEIESLAAKVRGKNYLLLSPSDELTTPISLQAWGFQLGVSRASDRRIDTFIDRFRQRAAAEPGATCSGGTQQTGTAPKASAQGGAGQRVAS